MRGYLLNGLHKMQSVNFAPLPFARPEAALRSKMKERNRWIMLNQAKKLPLATSVMNFTLRLVYSLTDRKGRDGSMDGPCPNTISYKRRFP